MIRIEKDWNLLRRERERADIEKLVRLCLLDAPEQFAHQLGVSTFNDGIRDTPLLTTEFIYFLYIYCFTKPD